MLSAAQTSILISCCLLVFYVFDIMPTNYFEQPPKGNGRTTRTLDHWCSLRFQKERGMRLFLGESFVRSPNAEFEDGDCTARADRGLRNRCLSKPSHLRLSRPRGNVALRVHL